MKRKNIVMVVMLLLIIGLMIFTVYKAANVGISGDMSGQSMSMQSDMAGEDNGNQPPEIPDGDRIKCTNTVDDNVHMNIAG